MSDIHNSIHFRVISLLFIFIPVTLLTGSFLPDFFLSILALYFLIISFRYRLINYYKNIFIYVFFIFYTYLIIRGLLSEYPFESLIKYNGPIFYFRYILFVLCIKFLLDVSPNIIKKFSLTLLIVVLLTCADGFMQWLSGTNFLGFKSPSIRVTGVFRSEEVLGHFLSHITPLLLALLSYCYGSGKKQFALIILLLMFSEFMIFVSNDRAGFLKITQFTILIIILSNNFKILRLASFTIMLIIIYILINNSPASVERFQQTVNDVSNTSIPFMPWSPNHENYYFVAFDMFMGNPIFGQGPQLFKTLCEIIPNYVNGCSSHPHNYYLQTLAELGVIGFLFIFIGFCYLSWLMLQHFIALWLISNPKKRLKDYYLFLICLLFIILWPLIPNNSFYNNWINVMIYLPIGFLMYFRNEKDYHL